MIRGSIELIVHADDFGLSDKVNEGILQAHLNGILTSTSIMANGKAFEGAVRIARANPTLDLGIHLTLIEEAPLLNANEVPTLLTPNGKFHRHAIQFTQRYMLGNISLKDVRKELEAQIKRVIAAGISPSHLDSHQHLHMLPGILNIVAELSRKYSIPAIRFPREIGVFGQIGRIPFIRIVQAQVLNLFCRMGDGKIKRRTDSFAGFLYGGNLNKQNFLEVLNHLDSGNTCEIMCHPGLEDTDSRYKHWGYHWSDELIALIDKEISDLLHHKRIHLISYRQLVNL